MKEDPHYKFIKVYSSPNSGEMPLIKSLLDGEKIAYYIKGENFAGVYGAANGLTTMDVMIREDFFENAKELLNDLINPEPK